MVVSGRQISVTSSLKKEVLGNLTVVNHQLGVGERDQNMQSTLPLFFKVHILDTHPAYSQTINSVIQLCMNFFIPSDITHLAYPESGSK